MPAARGFPRLYAAASLKLPGVDGDTVGIGEFSAALCRGLIEARVVRLTETRGKHVFRGFMPRPH